MLHLYITEFTLSNLYSFGHEFATALLIIQHKIVLE